MAKFSCEFVAGITSSGNKKTSKLNTTSIEYLAEVLSDTPDYLNNEGLEKAGMIDPFIFRFEDEYSALIDWGNNAPFYSTLEHYNFKVVKLPDNNKSAIPKMRMLDKQGKGSTYRFTDYQAAITQILATSYRQSVSILHRTIFKEHDEFVHITYYKKQDKEYINIEILKESEDKRYKKLDTNRIKSKNILKVIKAFRNSPYLSGMQFSLWGKQI